MTARAAKKTTPATPADDEQQPPAEDVVNAPVEEPSAKESPDEPHDEPTTSLAGYYNEGAAKKFVIVATHPIDLPGGVSGVPGDVVTLTDAAAEPLLADGHIVAKPADAGNQE
jgi:hypothetical protein